jgi:hypothetical protein
MRPRSLPWHALLDSLLADGATTAAIVDAMARAHPEVRRTQIDGRIKWMRGNRTTSVPNVGTPDAVASPLSSSPITLDQLLALFGIDLAEWEAVEVTPNVWHVGSAHPETGEILAAPLYQLKARLKRKAPAQLDTLRAALLADVAADTAHRPRYRLKPATPPDPSAESYMIEVETADVHIGKLAWGEETGTDYDSSIAEQLAREAVEEILWHAERYPVERFVLPVGNDLLHFELSGMTTNGTPQDGDTRWLKMFRRARGVVSWMISTLAERAPVHVVVVPGNHGRQGEMALGEVLAAEYGRDPRVSFDCSPAPRKYVQYGHNLLGLTHGDGEPHAKLPQLMAVEQPALWGESTHREFHVGHLHTSRKTEPVTVDDKLGVTVRILRSLSGVDRWHAQKGFLGTRGAEAFVWQKSGGIVAHFMTYVRTTPRAA